MTSLHLPTAFVCALLALVGRGSVAARCLKAEQVKLREERYHKHVYWRKTHELVNGNQASTCEQAIQEARVNQEVEKRSTSPWRYNLDRDESRVPVEIAVAECLCRGCIINQEQDHNFNSKPVVIKKEVLWKKSCHGNRTRHTLWREFIDVPIGCTCVRPEMTESD